jgi:hypothetical protein
VGGGDDRARKFEHRPRELVVVGHQHVNPARSSAIRHRSWPVLWPATATARHPYAKQHNGGREPKTTSVTPRFVRDGNRDLE